jgi:hypothetical protein
LLRNLVFIDYGAVTEVQDFRGPWVGAPTCLSRERKVV